MKWGGEQERKRRKEIPDYTTRIDHYEQISRESDIIGKLEQWRNNKSGGKLECDWDRQAGMNVQKIYDFF